MTISCNNILSNVTYSCDKPYGQGCTSPNGFQLDSLWIYTQSIQAACPSDKRLFLAKEAFTSLQKASLTQPACEAYSGKGWTYYPASDVWTRYVFSELFFAFMEFELSSQMFRKHSLFMEYASKSGVYPNLDTDCDISRRLTTWKFPLLQLVASFSRPPLGFRVECMVIFHLLGDPIDTIKNLLYKLSACQDTARFWEHQCRILFDDPIEDDKDDERYLRDRNWKALAIVTDSYGEWGEDEPARDILHNAL